MEQENKKLLSIDISARLPYNIKCQFTLKYGDNGHKEGVYLATITTFDGKDWLEVEYNDTNGASDKPWLRDWSCSLDDIKPYLRPMSSMTDEEKKELKKLEKQNKQKLIWDKFDDLMLKDLIEFIESGWSGNGKSHLIYWLKSIKDRIK